MCALVRWPERVIAAHPIVVGVRPAIALHRIWVIAQRAPQSFKPSLHPPPPGQDITHRSAIAAIVRISFPALRVVGVRDSAVPDHRQEIAATVARMIMLTRLHFERSR